MDDVLKLIRLVRRRVFCNRVLEQFFRAVFYVTVGIGLFVLGAKLVFLPDALSYVAWMAAAGVAASVTYALMWARTEPFRVALAADERLRLAERLSSALLVSTDGSGMAKAVVADARQWAHRARYEERFPISLPTRSWRVAVAVVALCLVLVLPQFDLLGRRGAYLRQKKEKEQVAREIKQIQVKVKEFKKTIAKSDLETMALIKSLEVKLAEIDKKGLGKKEALAAISKSLEDIAERMKNVAKQLAQKSREDAKLSSAADREALKKAAGQIAKLKEVLEKGKLTPEKGEEVAKALKEIADKLAKRVKSARDELEAMKKELEKDGLDDAEAKKLARAAKRLARMSQASDQLSHAIARASSSCAAGNCAAAVSSLQTALSGIQGQIAGAQAAEQIQSMANAMKGLSAFKQGLTGVKPMSLAEAMDQLNKACSACKGCCAGNRPGSGGGKGSGMGGPGIGEGNVWNVSDVQTNMQISNLKGDLREGKVLASFYTEGGQIKNEAKVEYRDVVVKSQQEAKDALAGQRIPRAYQDVVKNYFESLKTPGTQ